MDFKRVLSTVVIMVLCTSLWAADPAVLVHNTLDEINACKGKLKLKLVRVWGGDQENDEKKFFKTPQYLVVDKKDQVYIADYFSHNIKVFERDGTYLRTISRKGRGPGDVYGPAKMTFTPEGDLVVHESAGRRIQYFSPSGKSRKIINTAKHYVRWFDITSDNQLIVHMPKRTFQTKTLVSIVDEKLKTIKDIGVYHNTAKSYMDAEWLHYALDGSDNIIVTNSRTPVIRKYNLDGKMTLAVTYDTPFNLPIEVNLNQKGDEIDIKRPSGWDDSTIKKKTHSKGVTFSRIRKKGVNVPVCRSIGIDAENRIYLLVVNRDLTMEEMEKMPYVIAGEDTYKVIKGELPLDREMDRYKVLVFSPQGKVIGQAPITKELDGFIVSGNRLYITDPCLNKRILEYEISFEEGDVSRDKGVKR